MPMDEAANEAVDWAIKEDLLDGLISAEKDEVIGMILSEYNEEAFIKTLREDGYDEGLAEGFSLGEQKGLSEGLAQGERKKAVETARNLLKDGRYTAQEISSLLNIPVETFSAASSN
jgi:predicted transposase YdaD